MGEDDASARIQGLPDEVLEVIMSHMTLSTLGCFSTTYSTPSKLFPDQFLRRLHDDFRLSLKVGTPHAACAAIYKDLHTASSQTHLRFQGYCTDGGVDPAIRGAAMTYWVDNMFADNTLEQYASDSSHNISCYGLMSAKLPDRDAQLLRRQAWLIRVLHDSAPIANPHRLSSWTLVELELFLASQWDEYNHGGLRGLRLVSGFQHEHERKRRINEIDVYYTKYLNRDAGDGPWASVARLRKNRMHVVDSRLCDTLLDDDLRRYGLLEAVEVCRALDFDCPVRTAAVCMASLHDPDTDAMIESDTKKKPQEAMMVLTGEETEATRYLGTCTTKAMVEDGIEAGILPPILHSGQARDKTFASCRCSNAIAGHFIEFEPPLVGDQSLWPVVWLQFYDHAELAETRRQELFSHDDESDTEDSEGYVPLLADHDEDVPDLEESLSSGSSDDGWNTPSLTSIDDEYDDWDEDSGSYDTVDSREIAEQFPDGFETAADGTVQASRPLTPEMSQQGHEPLETEEPASSSIVGEGDGIGVYLASGFIPRCEPSLEPSEVCDGDGDGDGDSFHTTCESNAASPSTSHSESAPRDHAHASVASTSRHVHSQARAKRARGESDSVSSGPDDTEPDFSAFCDMLGDEDKGDRSHEAGDSDWDSEDEDAEVGNVQELLRQHFGRMHDAHRINAVERPEVLHIGQEMRLDPGIELHMAQHVLQTAHTMMSVVLTEPRIGNMVTVKLIDSENLMQDDQHPEPNVDVGSFRLLGRNVTLPKGTELADGPSACYSV